MSTAPSRRGQSWPAKVGDRAHRPGTAAAAVASTAAVFTAGWMGLGFVDGGEVDGIVVVLFLATVANAYAVTWVVWHRLVPRDAWSFARGVGTGLAIGVVAHATIGFAWALVAFAFDGWSASFLDLLGVGVTYSLYSVPMTLGIPIVLSVGVAVGLTYCRWQAVEAPTARK